MTWQRIDENTYIDDTLVTCAEYQLFIDEMREQERYYQPDHWITNQFPVGKAREPILGVRQSDAVAFCTWLTGRESKIWKFRLPAQQEAEIFLMKHQEICPVGYWLNRNNEFLWVDTIPEDARVLVITNNITLSAYQNSIHGAGSRALDITGYEAFHIVNRDGNRDISHSLYLAREWLTSRKGVRAHYGNFPHWLIVGLDREINRALEIYIDIFTLQERIAGRSPAFEGIRLVKERIR